MSGTGSDYFRRKFARHLIAVVCVSVTLYFVPYLIVFYAIVGLIDVARHSPLTVEILKRYFWGNGFPTLVMAPFNLMVDLLSKRNHQIYRLEDLPESYQEEISDAIGVLADKKDQLIEALDQQIGESRRGMLFLRWYDREMDQSVVEFDRQYTYIKTVAVSVFNKHQKTKMHFGPLRLTLRVLYNLTPVDSERVYIQVGDKKHYWRDEPLFIFDDTMIHQSVNETDHVRYCLFMDIVRPTDYPDMLNGLLRAVNFLMQGIKTVFYKNWSVLR